MIDEDRDLHPQVYDRFYATFQPVRVDDLKPGCAEWIGRRLLWEGAWMIHEGEGSYTGQLACQVLNDEAEDDPRFFPEGERPPFLWVPLIDLVDVEIVHTHGGWETEDVDEL